MKRQEEKKERKKRWRDITVTKIHKETNKDTKRYEKT